MFAFFHHIDLLLYQGEVISWKTGRSQGYIRNCWTLREVWRDAQDFGKTCQELWSTAKPFPARQPITLSWIPCSGLFLRHKYFLKTKRAGLALVAWEWSTSSEGSKESREEIQIFLFHLDSRPAAPSTRLPTGVRIAGSKFQRLVIRNISFPREPGWSCTPTQLTQSSGGGVWVILNIGTS